MPMRHIRVIMLVLWAVAGAARPSAAAGPRHYRLTEGSSITVVCTDCRDRLPPVPQPLVGGVDVTPLPLSAGSDVGAMTGLELTSADFRVAGRGFVQRIGADRQAMVLEATINGEPVLLTSGRRQPAHGPDITIVLTSARTESPHYVIVLAAVPDDAQLPDADADGVEDERDNCPTLANGDQRDADGDRVGDICDQCAESDETLVNAHGCSVAQLCPCDAPTPTTSWTDQAEYLRCVARATRGLRREGLISRGESLGLLRRALRSGCGRTVVALR
jgi:hypothetical protein